MVRNKYMIASEDIHSALLCVQGALLSSVTYRHTGLLEEDDRISTAEAGLNVVVDDPISPRRNPNYDHVDL